MGNSRQLGRIFRRKCSVPSLVFPRPQTIKCLLFIVPSTFVSWGILVLNVTASSSVLSDLDLGKMR